MIDKLAVTEAARDFSDVVNRVFHQGKSYLLTRGEVPVARLAPEKAPLTGAKLARRWESRPQLSPENAEAWAAELASLKSADVPPESVSWDI